MDAAHNNNVKFNYILGLINLVAVFFITWVLWYVFMHPNGTLKLYTPMYGFCLVTMLLSSVVLLSKVLDFGCGSEEDSSIGKGIALTVLSVILMLLITYGVFRNFVGRFGVAYFSPSSIIATGGTGAEPFNAREISSTAIVYMGAAFLWWALAWNVGFNKWPWQGNSRAVLSWSRLLVVTLLTIVTYAVLFHPHVCYLFYPAQDKAGVQPWWSSFAGTGSAFFSLGFILCSLMWIVISDILWEGYPWKWLDKNGEGTFWRGAVAIVITLLLGAATVVVLLQVMNVYWMEPFEGGQYTDAPYFRYIHAGEIAGFVILAAFILAVYFNNFPHLPGLWLNAVIRTVLAMVGGLVIWFFYYSSATVYLLGKVPGIGQPDDTPLVWTMLFLSLILIQSQFFRGRPLKTSQIK
jgi:amino acid transporter, AAT family